jgi:hypothetical protein
MKNDHGDLQMREDKFKNKRGFSLTSGNMLMSNISPYVLSPYRIHRFTSLNPHFYSTRSSVVSGSVTKFGAENKCYFSSTSLSSKLKVGVTGLSKISLSFVSVRFYPGPLGPQSKFSEDSSAKEKDEMNNNVNKKVENFTQDDKDMEDEITLAFDKCHSKEETEKAYETIAAEIKSKSSKFMEEIKEDLNKIKESIENSNHPQETKEVQKSSVDKELEKEMINEGEYTGKLLAKLQSEYEETREFFNRNETETDSSNKKSDDNNSVSQSENKNVETKDKGSEAFSILSDSDIRPLISLLDDEEIAEALGFLLIAPTIIGLPMYGLYKLYKSFVN